MRLKKCKRMMVSEARKPSPWVWISLGLTIGLFVAFILFLDQNIVKNAPQETVPNPQKNTSNKPVFDFYTVLPERKVDIPEVPQDAVKKPLSSIKKPAVVRGGKYVVQAGSFQNMKDADRQKAQLALLGMEAKITSARVKGVTYYRVELGPFTDREYSAVQKSLISSDFEFFVKKIH